MLTHGIEFKPYEFQEFPAWIDVGNGPILVQTKEEADALGYEPPKPAPYVGDVPPAEQLRALADFLYGAFPDEIDEGESAIQCAIRLLSEPDEDVADAPSKRPRGRPRKS